MKKGKGLSSQPIWSPACTSCARIRLRSPRHLSKAESTSCSSMARIASNTSRTTRRKVGECCAPVALSPGMTARRDTGKSFDFLNLLSTASCELPELLWHFVSNLERCRINRSQPLRHLHPTKRLLRSRQQGGGLREIL